MKITRATFLYLEPKARDADETFAQCWSCRMDVPKVEGLDGGRCVIHGSDEEIYPDDSCGFYVDWPTDDGQPNPEVVADHARELAKGIPGSVTPEESGLVSERVQCHRCEYGGSPLCRLYVMLNRKLPDVFDLDPRINPHACCNAWTKRAPTRAHRRYAEADTDG